MERIELESFEARPVPMTRGFAFLMGCRPTSALAKPLLRRQGTAWVCVRTALKPWLLLDANVC